MRFGDSAMYDMSVSVKVTCLYDACLNGARNGKRSGGTKIRPNGKMREFTQRT